MKQLFIIRIALIFGVAMFAALTVFLRQSGNLPEPDAAALERIGYMRYGVWGLSALAVAWAFLWKARAESAMSEQGAASSMILAWAPGEGAAILGVVTHFLGGPIATMAFGILAFIVVLLIARIPTPSR
ncbi:MAG: hypothetical protein IPJ78_03190 [Gemmatimonadetes bacterium]|jgi:hypothetical protein|nr:hypothetical protein [Gemmatimonadota bacterium]MBP7551739.1 hypothetical protein [Gemmatimonadaceae bacterium]